MRPRVLKLCWFPMLAGMWKIDVETFSLGAWTLFVRGTVGIHVWDRMRWMRVVADFITLTGP